MKRLKNVFSAAAFLAAISLVFAPAPASGTFQHCHIYIDGIACDHECTGSDVCCAVPDNCTS